MKKVFFLGAWVLFLASCGGKTTENVSNTPFSETDLFNVEKVTAFAGSLSDGDKKEAKKSFLNAIDVYRNKKSAEKALPLFTESLLKNPDAKTYYEYGNALLDTKDYPKSISAYHMAEQLNYSPLSKLMYNLACAYSLSKDEENALKYMELAIQNGYTNGEHILSDPDMTFARQAQRFNEVYSNAMSGSVSPEKALFDLYLNEYKEESFPYILTANGSQDMKFGEATISYDYEKFVPDMRDDRFSRDVGSEFYFAARFPKTETYCLTLYAEKSFWTEHPPINYYLCSYSPEGKLLDRLVVAGYPYFDADIKAFKIKDGKSFEVSDYSSVWEKDVNEHGYEDNRVVKRELISTAQYRVNSNGKFVSGKPLLGLLGR